MKLMPGFLLFLTLQAQAVSITEIHYNPPLADGDCEFLELYNESTILVDLSGYRLNRGIHYVFPDGTVLDPGEYWVLAVNATDFRNRYGFTPDGVYTGRLDNGGERITLENDACGLVVGASYINNLLDSNGWSELFEQAQESALAQDYSIELRDYVPGLGAHAMLSLGSLSMVGEYLAGLDEPTFVLAEVIPGSLAGENLAALSRWEKPSAWNVELASSFQLVGRLPLPLEGVESIEDLGKLTWSRNAFTPQTRNEEMPLGYRIYTLPK